MPTYELYIERFVFQQTTVEVEADSVSEAILEARERYEDDAFDEADWHYFETLHCGVYSATFEDTTLTTNDIMPGKKTYLGRYDTSMPCLSDVPDMDKLMDDAVCAEKKKMLATTTGKAPKPAGKKPGL